MVFGKIGREGLCGSGNTGILGGAGMSEMAGNIGPGGGVGDGGVFAGQPIFLIQSKIQIHLAIL